MATITIRDIRNFLMDQAFKNFKYNDKFFSDSEITQAIADTEEMFDDLPPLESVIDHTSAPKYILRFGVVGFLFTYKAFNEKINFNPGISENGINIPAGEAATIYDKIANDYMGQFEYRSTQYKVAKNTAALLNSSSALGSPYRTRTTSANSSGWYRTYGWN